MRIGLIGVGRVGGFHAGAPGGLPAVDCLTVTDTDLTVTETGQARARARWRTPWRRATWPRPARRPGSATGQRS